jgi:hypothetical protein
MRRSKASSIRHQNMSILDTHDAQVKSLLDLKPKYVVRKVLDIILLIPAIVQMWDQQESCLSRAGILSFSAAARTCCSCTTFSMRSTAPMRTFGAALRVRYLGVDRVANVIDGVAYYGESTLLPTLQFTSFVCTVKLATKEMGTVHSSQFTGLASTTTHTDTDAVRHKHLTLVLLQQAPGGEVRRGVL